MYISKSSLLSQIREHITATYPTEEQGGVFILLKGRVDKLIEQDSFTVLNYQVTRGINDSFSLDIVEIENELLEDVVDSIAEHKIQEYKLELYGTKFPTNIPINNIMRITLGQATAFISTSIYQLLTTYTQEQKKLTAQTLATEILWDYKTVFRSSNKILFSLDEEFYTAKPLACFILNDPYNNVLNHPHVIPMLCGDFTGLKVISEENILSVAMR